MKIEREWGFRFYRNGIYCGILYYFYMKKKKKNDFMLENHHECDYEQLERVSI